MARDDFDLAAYKGVHERIAEFRTQYPNGYISTFRVDVIGGVSFKAVVCKDANDAANYMLYGVAPATGHSFLYGETRAAVEKVEEFAETVAIGRALAILGYGVEKGIATSEEMAQFNRNKQAVEEAPEEEAGTPEVVDVKLKSTRFFNKAAKLTANK